MKDTQTLTRRRLVRAVALAALPVMALTGGSATAQAWPSKPISLIVPFPAGGTTDVLARALAEKLTQSLGQTVIVENKPGAGATLGADYVAKSKLDGYTLLVGAVHHTIASSVYKKLPYDFQKDLTPITTIALVPNVLVVNANTPAKNVAELVALLRAKPGQYNYGSNGNGTAQHLIGTQFQNMTGTELVHIPTRAAARSRPTCWAAR
jgi:tripartite-type tricarboxylate transporter receptor subunit TctC